MLALDWWLLAFWWWCSPDWWRQGLPAPRALAAAELPGVLAYLLALLAV